MVLHVVGWPLDSLRWPGLCLKKQVKVNRAERALLDLPEARPAALGLVVSSLLCRPMRTSFRSHKATEPAQCHLHVLFPSLLSILQ